MGGVQYSTLYFAEELKKNKLIDFSILLPRSGKISDEFKERGIPYIINSEISNYRSSSFSFINDRIRIPNPLAISINIFKIFLNIKIFKVILMKQNPKLVITKGLFNHIAMGISSISLGIPVIWHLQDLITNRYFGLYRLFIRALAKKIPDSIICDGDSIKTILGSTVSSKTKTILNGIKINNFKRSKPKRISFRKEFNIPTDTYLIGNVSRITTWKGQYFLIQAFIKYLISDPNSILILVGSPLFADNKYYFELRRIVYRKKLTKKIIFTGFRNDLDYVFSALDHFIYTPIEKDTSPLALISALASGLPVSFSDIDSLKELKIFFLNARTFNPKKINQIISLMKYYKDEKVRNKDGSLNLKNAKENFNITLHTSKMMEQIKTVINKKSKNI